ncbi:hypothetical protein F3Y22_tig00001120pilonHSYRG00074 [Hibiscus syriacus]|uniref:Uncharacterized protein n=1 Tax=Hibiscus syriacus TaxID=106335 RepID=A0A6A3CVY2_HIBSY|nr:hypothetical protein F3Y22_tig00001120pilonHSYRG00074 [Hibiscus syriacus]
MKSRPSDDYPIASGWKTLTKLRYAVLISLNDAVLSTLRISYKLPATLFSAAEADLTDEATIRAEFLTVAVLVSRGTGELLLTTLTVKGEETVAIEYMGKVSRGA